MAVVSHKKKNKNMDYEEKYKKAIKLAKEALESGSYDEDTIAYIFPELFE